MIFFIKKILLMLFGDAKKMTEVEIIKNSRIKFDKKNFVNKILMIKKKIVIFYPSFEKGGVTNIQIKIY